MTEQPNHDYESHFPKKDAVKDNLLVDLGNLKDYCTEIICQVEDIERVLGDGYIPQPELSYLIENIFQLSKRLIRVEHGCDLYQKHTERQQ